MLEAVKQNYMWLFCPVPGNGNLWNLIIDEDWQSSVHPGMQLGMSLFGNGVSRKLVSAMLSKGLDDVGISFQKPLPQWAPYPQDAKFKTK
jgi:hypothetical protein